MTFSNIRRCVVALAGVAAGIGVSSCRVEYDARASAARMIGVTLPVGDTGFTLPLEAGLREGAVRQGYELSILRVRNLVGQQSAIDGFVTQHVDAIIVVPIDTARIASAMERASALRVPVFALRHTRNGRAQGAQTIAFVADYFDGRKVPTRSGATVRMLGGALRAAH